MVIRIFSLVLSLILLLATVACGGKSKEANLPSDVKSQSVTVTFFSGDVKVVRSGEARKPAQGMVLASEDELITGANGRVEVLVQNSGLIKVSHSSAVSISSLTRGDDGSDTNIHIAYGKVVTVVKKEKKNESVNVVTPTLVAGVRGTIFVTSVENPRAEGGDITCSQSNCLVKVNVVEGAVAVRHKETGKEVVVEKNSGIAVQGKEEITRNLVKPLGSQSLEELKEMIVFHKSDIGGFENLADELKLQTRELSALDSAGSLTDVKEKDSKKVSSKTNDEIRKVADETDESRYLKKDIAREKLKMEPKESF